MDTFVNEPRGPESLSIFEQAVLDRQMFDFYQQIPHPDQLSEQEDIPYELLDLLVANIGDKYSWVRTENAKERTDLAQAVLEIKQHQDIAFLEKGVYPDGPETYRALRRSYQDKDYTGTSVYLAEAIMDGDLKEGTIPILSSPASPTAIIDDTYSTEYIL